MEPQRDREAWMEAGKQSSIERAGESNMDVAPLTQEQPPRRQPLPTPHQTTVAVARQGGGNRDGPRLVLLQLRAGGIQPHAALSAVYQGLTILHAGAGNKKDGSVMGGWGVGGEGPAMQGCEQEFKQRCKLFKC